MINIKSKLLNPKVQQSILEVIFPIVGYFFWDWSLIVIIVFYLCDFFSSQVMYTKRLSAVVKHSNGKFKSTIVYSAVIFLILFTCILGFLAEVFSLTEPTSSNLEKLIFFTKDELWYLLPMILLMYYMTDKMFFFMPRRFTQLLAKSYFSKNLFNNIISTCLILVSIIIYNYYQTSDIITILLLVTAKLLFDYFIKKRLLHIEH